MNVGQTNGTSNKLKTKTLKIILHKLNVIGFSFPCLSLWSELVIIAESPSEVVDSLGELSFLRNLPSPSPIVIAKGHVLDREIEE